MGYYLRFIVTDPPPLSVAHLDAALRSVDPAYTIDGYDLRHGDGLYGEIEVNPRGTGLCDEELGELADFIEDAGEGDRARVLAVLKQATAIVAVRVLWQGREAAETLTRLDPLWGWLFDHRAGLLQADGEGYYDEDGRVLDVP